MNKTLITTLSEFKSWFPYEAKEIAFDTETTSLNYYKLEIDGISFCDGKKSCYIDFENFDNKEGFFLFLREEMKTRTWLAHSMSYDSKVFYKYGIDYINNPICTLVGAHLLNENQSIALKFLAEKHLGANIVKYNQAAIHGHHTKEFYDYGMNDSIWCWQLWQIEKNCLRDQGLEHLFYKVEMPFQNVLRDMEINGLLVDMEEYNRVREDCNVMIRDYLVRMCKSLGTPFVVQGNFFGDEEIILPINFNSSDQLAYLIEEVLKVKITELTENGNKSVGEPSLAKIKDEHEFISLLAIYKKLAKLSSGFLESFEKYIDEDGRLRTSYGLNVTGRLNSSFPNLQNMPNPKKDELGINFRRVFIPKKGYKFVVPDFSGQELRILAIVTGDEALIDAFNNNIDVHLLTANRIFNLNLSKKALTERTPENDEAKEKHKLERHRGKNGANFPIIYGSTKYGISKNMKVTEGEAQKWIDTFHELYPQVKVSIEKTRKELEKNGYVTTLMGRRRRFPDYKKALPYEKEAMLRQAFNFKIQGFAADMTKLSAVQTIKVCKKYGAEFLLQVHDEYVFEVPEENAEEFAVEIRKTMSNCVALRVAFDTSIKICSDYGD